MGNYKATRLNIKRDNVYDENMTLDMYSIHRL